MVDISKALQSHDDAPDAGQSRETVPPVEAEEIDDADLLAAADLELERMAAERRAQEASNGSQGEMFTPAPVKPPRKKRVPPEGVTPKDVATKKVTAKAVPEANAAPIGDQVSVPVDAPGQTEASTQDISKATAAKPIDKTEKMPMKKTGFVPIKAVDGVRLDQPQDTATVTPKNRHLQEILAGTAAEPKTTAQIVTENAMMNPLKTDGIIMRGDTPLSVEADPTVEETLEEKLVRLGFPPRPARWPVFIDWPPREIAEKFTDPAVSDEQRQKMIRLMLTLEEASIRRARQLNEWLNETNPPIPPRALSRDGEARNMRRNLRIMKETQDDPHYSIRWATLINPMSQNEALLNSVVTWSQTSATTLDGGQVLVDKDSISFSGGSRSALPYTPQAIALGIQEAKNRGWKTLKMSGSYEFGQMAIKAAREAGIEAEIIFYGKGLGSWTRHTVKVSPNVPFVDKDITEMMAKAMGDPVSDQTDTGGPSRHVPAHDQSPFPSRRDGQRSPALPDHDPRDEAPPFDPSMR